MEEDERGVIRNKEYARRFNNFSGMRWGNITPTDLDGMMEYRNICYVYIETKYKNAELPFGQRLALERQCDDMSKVKPALLIVASYENDTGDIDVANTTVTEYRFKGKWHESDGVTTTRALSDRFISWATLEAKK